MAAAAPSLLHRPRVQRAALAVAGALPAPVSRALAGPGRERDGQRLEPDLELMLRLLERFGWPDFAALAPPAARREVEREARMLGGRVPFARGFVDSSCIDIDMRGQSRTNASARLHVPRGASAGGPLLVWFHGGGFVVGSPATIESACRFIARHANARVLAVPYRLAPEHPFPAAVDDAQAGYRWAQAHAAELGADPSRISVGGDSAGGCLAAVVAREADPRPRAQLLLYPVTDLAEESPSYETFAEGPFLTAAQMRWFRRHYLADEADARDPRASPLLAPDLDGLPAAYVAVAGFDPLRNEGLAYAERLRNAGVDTTLALHPGQLHAFAEITQASPSAREALRQACDWLRRTA